jgi:glycerate 2-kinase
LSEASPIGILSELFGSAIEAANPVFAVPPHLPPPPKGRTLVLAAGKAAAAMAYAVEANWPGALSGIAVTRYGHGMRCERIEVIEAGHPLPDDAGRGAARRFLEAARALGPDDLLLVLVSGGASALLVEPAPGLSLEEKQGVTRALLASGAPIGEMNCLRKHLSAIKGGRLAALAAPARVVTLAVSDVPGDDPAVIGSGPTVGDPTTCRDALAIADRRNIPLPAAARDALTAGAWESVKPGDPALTRSSYEIVAKPADSLAAAAARARDDFGLEAVVLGADIEGEAREVAVQHATLAKRSGPGVILSGGETTVTVTGSPGHGGRNCEYLLALAIALDGAPGIHAIACDTDGIDGTEDTAGAVIGPDTLERARAAGLDPAAMLAAHESYTFFDAIDDLIMTGPTRTNVNDFRAILIEP